MEKCYYEGVGVYWVGNKFSPSSTEGRLTCLSLADFLVIPISGIPCSLVQYLSDFSGGRKRYLFPSTPPPDPHTKQKATMNSMSKEA